MIPQPIFAWPLVGSQVLIFGTSAFALVAAPRDVVDGEISSRSMATLWRILALIVLVISPLRFLSVAAGMADSTFREVVPMMPQIMRETFAGRVWTWRLATTLLLAIVAWIPAPGRFSTASICVISAVLLALQSVTSHAVDKGAFAITVHFAHQAAAGLWIGALVSLLIGATYGNAGAEWLRAATSRVSIDRGMVGRCARCDRRDQGVGRTRTTTRSAGELDLRAHALVESWYGGDGDPDWRLQSISAGRLGGRIVGARLADSQCGRGMRSAGCSAWMVGSTG